VNWPASRPRQRAKWLEIGKSEAWRPDCRRFPELSSAILAPVHETSGEFTKPPTSTTENSVSGFRGILRDRQDSFTASFV